MTPKVVYPEYDDAGEEEEIFQSEDSQVLIFMALMGKNDNGQGVDDKLCFEQDVGLTWLDRKQVC